MLNVSDLQQEQAATGGLGYPFLESLKPSSFLTLPLTKSFPFTTKGAHLETALFSYLMTLCCGWTRMPQHMGFSDSYGF